MKKMLPLIALSVVGVLVVIWLYGASLVSPPGTGKAQSSATAAGNPDGVSTESGSTNAEAGSTDRSASSTPDSAPGDTSTAAAAPPVAFAPLPSVGTPVAEILETLKTRAAQGDSTAMCRLAYELQRCSEAEWARSVSSTLETDLARRPTTPTGAPETLARMQGFADQRGVGCEGVTAEDRALAFEMQMRAAEARPQLRVWAALNPALDPWNMVNELDQWKRYRERALTWLEQAAAEGDVSAIIAMQRVHGDMRRNSPPYPRFRVQDDERFVMYTELLKRYGVEFGAARNNYESRRAALDPETLGRIEQQVAALHRPEVASLTDAQRITALDYSMRNVPEPEDCSVR